MPISHESFDRGETLSRSEVLSFLRLNREQAHSIQDIHQATRTSLEYSVEELQEVLEALEVDRLIESKVLEGIRYYRMTRWRLGRQMPG